MAGERGRRKGESRPQKGGSDNKKTQATGAGRIRGFLLAFSLCTLLIGAGCLWLWVGTPYDINHMMLFLGIEILALGIMVCVHGLNAKVLEGLSFGAGLIKATGLTLTFVLMVVGTLFCLQAVGGPGVGQTIAFVRHLGSQRLRKGVPEPLARSKVSRKGEGGGTQIGEYDEPRQRVSQLAKPIVLYPSPYGQGYTVAPIVQITALSEYALHPDSITAYLGKVRLYPNAAMPQLAGDRLSPSFSRMNRQLVLDVNTAPIIDKMYPDTPHGFYRLKFTLADDLDPLACETYLDFNYIYCEDFKNLGRALMLQQAGFSALPEGGLQAQNYSRSGRYVSARLSRAFDFTTNFFALGCLSIECEDANAPPGFDVAFLDERYVSQLSVIFVDGRFDTVAIKARGDEASAEGVRSRARPTTVAPSTKDCLVYNDFLISIQRQTYGHLCRVHVGVGAHEASQGSLIHERLIETHLLERNLTRVELRLWKAGIARLHYLMIGEMGPP